MDQQRWLEVRRLFEAIVELPADRRGRALDEACAGDEALRREVSSLLDADAAPDDLLDAGPPGLDVLDAPGTPDASPPSRIGAYRVLEEVGRGGMGVVYRAERADGTFDRAVALKLVRGGFDSGDVVDRFHAERRILANLEHPNVARLYDAGLADDGRPYLVMEYVAGEPIDRYCDARRLDVQGRLRLFRGVCDAVQYAHRNLVIHRDLKPSNILVDDDGAVHLLDFGIARLTEPERADAPQTRTGHRMLTPEYAAPEQIRGDALTTSSDVYSLGVVLYELLTGRRPFDGWVRSVAHALGDDPTSRPPVPSRVVTQPAERAAGSGAAEPVTAAEAGRRRGTSPERLRRTLRGDLDRILLKALARDPAERYASVEALADDLDRYLRGLPVHAQAPSLPYRARKFARRHRAGLAATAVVLLAVGAAGAIAARESREAAAEREAALGVAAFLEDLFQASDPRELQVQDTTRMIDFLDASAGRVRTEIEDQPRTKARMLLVLGTTFNNIGRSDRAESLLREAITANLAVHGDRHEDVAEAQRVLGLLLVEQDRYDEAIPMLESALETQRSLTGERSWEMGRLHEAVGRALMSAGQPEPAVPHVEASLQIRREVLEPDDPVLTSSLNTLGALKLQLGHADEAIPLFEEAIELSLRIPNTVPEDIGVQRMNLALVLMRVGRYDEALEQTRQGHRILETNERQWVVARSRSRLAEAIARVWAETRADTLAAEADSLFRSGIALMRSLPQASQVRYMLHAYGRFLQQRGDLAAAETAMREVLALSAAAVGAGHPETNGVRASVAAILLDAGRATDAEPLAREAHAALVQALPVGHPTRTSAATTRARVLLALGRPAEAAELLAPVHATTAEALGEDHPLVRAQRETLADAYEATGRDDDAQRLRGGAP